jgi:hypothetical protein
MKAIKVSADLEREIAGLASLPRRDLVTRWKDIFKEPPPKGLSRRLMCYAIAYAMQVKHYGGLPENAKRQLNGQPRESRDTAIKKVGSAKKLAPGTRLIREWNGIIHVVDVADKGFIWKGKNYRSLSALAKTITGARWSGPRFFQLSQDDAS